MILFGYCSDGPTWLFSDGPTSPFLSFPTLKGGLLCLASRHHSLLSFESFYQMIDTDTLSDNLPESFSSLKNESNN